MKEQIIFTDRYSGNYPDQSIMCKGDCEGMGVVPIHRGDLSLLNEKDSKYLNKWDQAESINLSRDGYHFLVCNDCNGTGKQ